MGHGTHLLLTYSLLLLVLAYVRTRNIDHHLQSMNSMLIILRGGENKHKFLFMTIFAMNLTFAPSPGLT